jgi:hypothetical protein
MHYKHFAEKCSSCFLIATCYGNSPATCSGAQTAYSLNARDDRLRIPATATSHHPEAEVWQEGHNRIFGEGTDPPEGGTEKVPFVAFDITFAAITHQEVLP